MRASAEPAPPRGRLKLTTEGLGWLASAAVLGALGWSKSLNLLLMLAYVMLALLVLNGVLARLHAMRASSRRVLPVAVLAGESAENAILVENHSSRTASVQVADRDHELFASDLAASASLAFPVLERFSTRGRVRLPNLVTCSGYPFGFLRFERTESVVDSVAVLPALGEADADGLRRWLLRMAGSEGRSRKTLRRVTHDHAEVRGVRPYRPGDSLRSVHWRTSARRRELMVREYDAAPSPELLLVVDPWLPVEPTTEQRAALEAAFSLAATIASTWCRALDTRVTLVVEETVSQLSNDTGLREALVPLADASGSDSPQPPDAFVFGRHVSRAARLVVSSRPDSPLASSLARVHGHAFATVDVSQALPWYAPPRPGGAA